MKKKKNSDVSQKQQQLEMLNKKLIQLHANCLNDQPDENKPRYMQNTKSSSNLLNFLENSKSEHFSTILKAYETNKMTAE